MATTNIDLPESVQDFVQIQVVEGGYGSVGEYLRDLIEADQLRKSEERIDDLLIEGLDSGPSRPMTPENWEAKHKRLSERLKATQG